MKRSVKIAVLLLGILILAVCTVRLVRRSDSGTREASTALVKESISSVPSSSSSKESQENSSVATREESQRTSDQEQLQTSSPSDSDQTQTETETGEATPVRKLLSVRPQQQQVWYYCAPTTVSMMLSARGVEVSQFDLAKEMGTYEPYGTHNRDAIRILNKHLFGYETPTGQEAGYRLAVVTDASPDSQDLKLMKERIKRNIDDGYPIYYTFMAQQIYPGKKGEHNAIGIGYELTADGKDIAALYYLDPDKHVDDPVYGALKKVTPQELIEAMVTCGEPNYAW